MKRSFKIKLKNPISLVIIVLISLLILNLNKNIENWESIENTFQADVAWYYSYLPATFLFNDISLEFTDTLPEEIKKQIKYISLEENRLIKTTMGLSYIYAPFFFIGHIIAKVFEYPLNGYSLPYRLALVFSNFFFLVFGVIFLRKLLLLFFSDLATALSITAIVAGTNLIYYSTFLIGMSHVYGFTLYILFIYYTIKWFKTQEIKYSIILGFIAGLLILIRPTNILIVLIFILCGIRNFKDIKLNIQLFLKNYWQVILIILIAFIIWIPQFIYWKKVTNHFIFFSYTGERFFFNQPQIIKALFSYRNGWILYSPAIILGFIGFITFRKYKTGLFIAIAIFTLLYIYITSSWWCWWFPGFGNRAYIEASALLALPLASLVDYFKRNKIAITAIFLIIVAFVYYHDLYIKQFRNHAYDYHGMTKKSYWTMFLKAKVPKSERIYFEYPHYEKALEGKEGIRKKYIEDRYGVLVDEYINFAKIEKGTIHRSVKDSALYFKVNLSFYPIDSISPKSLLLVAELKNNEINKTLYTSINKKDYEINVWNNFEYTFKFDSINSQSDFVNIYIHHVNENRLYIDKLVY